MLNFLPQKNRNSIIFEYILRINVFLLFFVFVAGLFLTSLFLPSYFFVSLKKDNITSQLESLKQNNTNKGDDPIAFIKSINKLSVVLSENPNTDIKDSEIIGKIISLKNPNIIISSINITPGVTGGRSVSVTGISKSRDSLSSFEKEIKMDSYFKNSLFPVSNFIKSSNSDFSAILTI